MKPPLRKAEAPLIKNEREKKREQQGETNTSLVDEEALFLIPRAGNDHHGRVGHSDRLVALYKLHGAQSA